MLKMPLARYFLFVGGALLALLLIVNTQLPNLPVAQSTYNAAAELPPIRIHSDRKWPERVVFDTSVATVAPPVVIAQASAPAPAIVAEVTPKIRVRDAFAQLRPSDLELKASDPAKPQAAVPQKRKIAKKHVAPPMVLVAQQPQFGLFGRTTW